MEVHPHMNLILCIEVKDEKNENFNIYGIMNSILYVGVNYEAHTCDVRVCCMLWILSWPSLF